MGIRGPTPKHPALRQRRNKVSTTARLVTAEEAALNEVPPMPPRENGWHEEVTEWWSSVWKSPMASEWLDSDKFGGLYLLADLYQHRWTVRGDAKALAEVSKEIRAVSAEFGLTPMTRRRLQWEISRGEEAEDKTQARRRMQQQTPKAAAKDPRSVLRLA